MSDWYTSRVENKNRRYLFTGDSKKKRTKKEEKVVGRNEIGEREKWGESLRNSALPTFSPRKSLLGTAGKTKTAVKKKKKKEKEETTGKLCEDAPSVTNYTCG